MEKQNVGFLLSFLFSFRYFHKHMIQKKNTKSKCLVTYS